MKDQKGLTLVEFLILVAIAGILLATFIPKIAPRFRSAETQSVVTAESAESRSKDIRYIQDKRTGLCFAYLDRPYLGAITMVPCDKAQGLIENPWSR